MKYLDCLYNLKLLSQIEKIKRETKNKLVFLCMGNKNVNFDCFASLIADKLREKNIGAYIYGGEKYPLYGESLNDLKRIVEKIHKNDTVIFVDVVKTKNLAENGEIFISTNNYQVANSNVRFNYNYSLCYKVFLDGKIDHYNNQYNASCKIIDFILNCFKIF